MLIKNGRIALPGGDDFFYGDLRIEDEKIVEIGNGLTATGEIFDAGQMLIFPGVIDAHVHFDDPGYTHREDFYHGSAAAASGGVTTVIDMPCTSVPPVTNLHNLKKKLEIVRPKAVVDFGFYGGVSALTLQTALGGDLEEMSRFILGVKTYFISGMDTFPSITPEQLKELLQYTKALNLPVLLHTEDLELIEKQSRKTRSRNDTYMDFYQSRPEGAEILAVKNAIRMAEAVKARLHIVHVGTGEATSFIGESRFVSGETAPHYLAFSVEDMVRIGPPLKVTPPVKKAENRQQLWDALIDDKLSFVASDHAPAPQEEKFTGSVWTDYSGIPGSGTMFPFLLSEGYLSGKLSLQRLLEVSSSAAAKQYGLNDRKGSIDVGKDADLVIVNPERKWRVEGKKFLSKGKITPFEGVEFNGRVTATMCRGKWVYKEDSGICIEQGYGKFLTRKSDE